MFTITRRKEMFTITRRKEMFTITRHLYTGQGERIFQRNANGIDDNWQMCDMRSLEKENKEVSYILTVIDVFSKFAFIR